MVGQGWTGSRDIWPSFDGKRSTNPLYAPSDAPFYGGRDCTARVTLAQLMLLYAQPSRVPTSQFSGNFFDIGSDHSGLEVDCSLCL